MQMVNLAQVFERVQERAGALGAAYRVAETAERSYQAATDNWKARQCEQHAHALITTGSAMDEAQGDIINAAQTLLFALRMVMEACPGQYPSLNERAVNVREALKAETLAFEAYNTARPDQMQTALLVWKDSRLTVVRAARKLLYVCQSDGKETEVDDGA